MSSRKIIHIDMDAFFASVEQRDNPAWRAQPLVVGGQPNSRGVVAAASYEARQFGIRSAMPSAHAYRLCPQAVFVKPRFEAYREVSRQLHALFEEYTELVEPLSLDEAYLDVSDCEQHKGSATLIAREIKSRIAEQTGLTASAGVSYNKFLAKVASDEQKPDGLTVITPKQGPEFVARLPIGKFYGVGKVTEGRMKSLGIHTGLDLRQWPLEKLVEYFGKQAKYYYDIARGVDHRPVESERVRKSIGAETTFQQDVSSLDDMQASLRRLAHEVANSLHARCLCARTLTIKVKYANFEQVTRAASFKQGLYTVDDLLPWLPVLLARTEASSKPVRLLGVSLSGLEVADNDESQQLALF
jgi:DNA polymerase-4